jgi:hypothetical protein
MSAVKNKDTRRASEIVKHLEGTLIADLKSLKMQALTANKPAGHGSLNYTIFLVGLVGCETIGRYVCGSDLDQPKNGSAPDPGGYISRFIEEYFPKRDSYKSISKILSDYLRHILVHGFAPREDGYPFDLHLTVSTQGHDIPPLAVESNNRLAIQLDAISFVNKVVAAFEKVKQGSERDAELAKKIVAAEDASKKISPPKMVTNQFIASYAKLQKKS